MEVLTSDAPVESILEVNDLKKSYDSKTILAGSTFSVYRGEFLSILGPSGCGKTTTLRLLIGLETPTSGTISSEGHEITNFSPSERGMGIVFQDYALFENLSVRENVTYPLRFRDDLKERRTEIAHDLLERVGLADQVDKRIGQLSGGQQQRVSIARTLALNPHIILFDEPMSALDVETRLALRTDLKTIQHEFGTTMIYVTHDQEEAFALSDRVMVMGDGRIHQLATPEEILSHPASEFVERFVIDNLSKKMSSLSRFSKFIG
jgi:ABC-type Fe3+/spermidine/putrescine transport system ATPase subunit